jgi:hypothetical protein
MSSHRASYLKTTLGALAASVFSFALAGYVVARWLSLPTVAAEASGAWLFMYWVAVAVLVALGLLCLLVGTGGLFALHDDAKERGAVVRSRPSPSAR